MSIGTLLTAVSSHLSAVSSAQDLWLTGPLLHRLTTGDGVRPLSGRRRRLRVGRGRRRRRRLWRGRRRAPVALLVSPRLCSRFGRRRRRHRPHKQRVLRGEARVVGRYTGHSVSRRGQGEPAGGRLARRPRAGGRRRHRSATARAGGLQAADGAERGLAGAQRGGGRPRGQRRAGRRGGDAGRTAPAAAAGASCRVRRPLQVREQLLAEGERRTGSEPSQNGVRVRTGQNRVRTACTMGDWGIH